MNKSTKLKTLLNSSDLEFIMEAHNGLSAKIVEEAGFKGIWASGLSISASLGVRDNNEASWTQVLEVLEFMSDATTIPILMDGDTGFGNFNNARRLVKKLEQIGIAGVCIEDKQFPKTNSFLNNAIDELADPYEFGGKIKAMKDAQKDKDFVVAARIEAYNVGLNTDEAIKRGHIYVEHGADALLIHSKKSNPADIDDFIAHWDRKDIPIIIVPTKYYMTPTEHFRKAGVSLCIWANHNLRACITAMKSITADIYRNQSLISIEDKIASVNEVFRLQCNDELEEAENNYLPKTNSDFNAIILAASKGDIDELEEIPKTLVNINGKPILKHQIDTFMYNKIHNIYVVCGYNEYKINIEGIKKIINTQYATTTELTSLAKAYEEINETGVIISYGDLFFRKHLITELFECGDDFAITVNPNCGKYDYNEYVTATEHYEKYKYDTKAYVKYLTTQKEKGLSGYFSGIILVKGVAASEMKRQLKRILDEEDATSRMIELLNRMIKNGFIPRVIYAGDDSCVDINTLKDIYNAGKI